MSFEETLRKLNEMKLFGMARSFEEKRKSPEYKDSPPEEYLGYLVDDEYLYRKNNRLKRLLETAKLKIPQSSVEEIDYRHPRSLTKSQVLGLQNTDWLDSYQNVLITGPTGVGKSYLACALGQWACRMGYSTLYQRWPRLLGDLFASRGDGTYLKHLDRLAKVKLLIIDDFGINPLNESERKDFLEIVEDRYMSGATVITSQLPSKDWHAYIGDATLADAICDRLFHVAHKFELKGESMRKKKGKD